MLFVKRNPPEWELLLADQAKPRTGLHVTDCLGCPRRRRLVEEGAPVDLARLEARLTGTILHRALAEAKPETAEVPVSGVLFGLQIRGNIDRIEDAEQGSVTVDYKTGEGKGKDRRLPEAPYAEEVWQQEGYRFIRLKMGFATVGWRIYYRWDKVWYVYEHIGPIWNEAKLAEFRPHGGAFTTAEIAGQVVSKLPAASLPLVGATQKIGAGTSCDYCEVALPCGQIGAEVDL